MSREKEHRCPAPGCVLQVPSAVLACHTHWFQLSPAVRAFLLLVALGLVAPRRAVTVAAMNEWKAQA